MHILANPIAPDHLLGSFGLIGMAIILFAECGLLVGFFLPGDTLLLAAGDRAGGRDDPHAAGRVPDRGADRRGRSATSSATGSGTGPGRSCSTVRTRRMFRPEYVTRSHDVLRPLRLGDGPPRPLRADRPHRRHRDGRCRQDALRDLRGRVASSAASCGPTASCCSATGSGTSSSSGATRAGSTTSSSWSSCSRSCRRSSTTVQSRRRRDGGRPTSAGRGALVDVVRRIDVHAEERQSRCRLVLDLVLDGRALLPDENAEQTTTTRMMIWPRSR